jgi:hypothetical protein
MWHIGRSAGAGLFSSVCTGVAVTTVLLMEIDSTGGIAQKNARYLPAYLFGLACMIGPVAGVLWHQFYVTLDKGRSKQRGHSQ